MLLWQHCLTASKYVRPCCLHCTWTSWLLPALCKTRPRSLASGAVRRRVGPMWLRCGKLRFYFIFPFLDSSGILGNLSAIPSNALVAAVSQACHCACLSPDFIRLTHSHRLADVLTQLGSVAAARRVYFKALEGLLVVYGPAHAYVTMIREQLAAS